jgi:transcriptional repressor NrdR
MKCPFCDDLENRVVDSRLTKEGGEIRRRRECFRCKRRFTTYERIEETMPLIVKKDGRRETYDRAKIVAGLQRACEKRPVSVAAIDAIADAIETSLMERGEKEVPSSVIGEAVMRHLHELDQVAYVRFASVYRSFKDVGEFMRELEDLITSRQANGKKPKKSKKGKRREARE